MVSVVLMVSANRNVMVIQNFPDTGLRTAAQVTLATAALALVAEVLLPLLLPQASARHQSCPRLCSGALQGQLSPSSAVSVVGTLSGGRGGA